MRCATHMRGRLATLTVALLVLLGLISVEYKGGQRELYNMRRDPWELNSRADDPTIRRELRTLRRILGDLRRCRGASCSRIADPSVR